MKISLKYLILLVALLSVALTLFSSISSGYRVNKETLIENTLETNRVYAQKLASTTDEYLNSTLQTLAYSASDIARFIKEEDLESRLLHETERLIQQTNTFNSVIIATATGEVLAASPETLEIVGEQLSSQGSEQALLKRAPIISNPYISVTNRLIVFISHPIFDGEGTYLGYIGGSIYLQKKNILNDLLGEHFYQDGSYVYIADEDGRLLYHPDLERIGAFAAKNPVIQRIMKGESGASRVTNTEGIDMLAGYAYMPTTKWGVVSQRPTQVALVPSKDMRNEMIVKTLPFLLLSFILIIYIASKISQPLQKLAHYARASTKKNEFEDVENVKAWYYEAIQLEKALVKSFSYFQDKVNFFIHESTTDPLTGLVNRRAMDEKTKLWLKDEVPFSLIMLDIDKFKRVNDTYGHTVGDEVLKFLAKEMQAVSRSEGVCCRYGGEEFILLLPRTSLLEAYEVAERLRKKLESTISPPGVVITISAGLSNFPETGKHILELIEAADKCLYEAKNTGRNKTIMAKNRFVLKETLKV